GDVGDGAGRIHRVAVGGDFGSRVKASDIEVLAAALGKTVEDYIELDGPIGNWIREKRAKDAFAELPTDLQEFVTDPKNRSHLQLARKLAQIPADRLRSMKQSFDEIIP
ncbi:MAG: hypothetical protein ACLFWD_11915, partial [Anaerolineales bacterium]